MPSDTSGVGGQAPARLEVRLLGGVEIILDGRRLRAFNSLRLQRFLALIVLRRDPQHRSRLAFELWPDSDEPQARTNLRKLLHDFRHSLPDIGEFVEIDNEIVRWIGTGPSEVDVLRLQDAMAAGDFELAARLYSGDLLPACYDDWVIDERAKLRAQAYGAFVRLTEEAARRGDHKDTIRHTQRIIDLEPTDEAAVRFQMEAHLALGDRAAALRCYHRYAQMLERDLGVAPGAAIGAMYQQLRAGALNRDEVQGKELAPVGESPFVGRDLEWKQLIEAWNTARTGRAHLVLVTGEPGIGKSRLALELGRRDRAEGHLVASARAYEAAGRLPWGPVVELLRSDALRSHIDTLDTVWRAELARLLPELRDASQPSAPTQAGDVAQRHRLFDAVNRAIVAGDRPRLLIIDDLQWCDAETIELIGFLVRSGKTAPVLIVGTVRWEEIPPHHPLVGLVDALGHDQAVTTVPLDRLDEATTATLAARLRAEDTIDPKLAARLWRETEGNPLFVIEALRAGISSDGSQAVLTPTMRAVLRARLGQLTDDARRLAEVAAVIGRPFSVGLMVSATGTDERELVDHVDELWRRRIIREQGLTYDFSHDKLRAVALEMVSPARRRQLHRAVAEAIAVERHKDIDAASPQLAAHYDQAGMVEPAIDAYRVAGARAVAVSAFEEAVTLFRRALALLADLPPSPDRDALELDIRIALGSPLVAIDGYGSKAAHQLYERALSLCRKLHRPVDPPILRGLGLAQLQGCRFDDCDELARALLEHESDPIARTEGRYLLGVSAFWRGDLAGARHYLEGALEAYDVSHRDQHLALYAQDPKAVCLVRLAWVELWAGDAGRADETARSALGIAVHLDHLMTLGYVTTYAAIIAAESEDLARLAELLGEADRLWKRFSDRYLMVVLEALRGWLEVCGGSAGGIEKILRSVARSRTEGETLHLSYTLLLLARARGMIGEFREGRAATREALAWAHRCNQRYLEAELWRVDGELAYRSGEAEAAAASLRRAVEVARAQGAGGLELRAHHSFASRFPDEALREQRGADSGRSRPPEPNQCDW